MDKTQLNETDVNQKMYLVTNTRGEQYVAMLTDMERDKIKQAGGTVEDPATGTEGTSSSVMAEEKVEQELSYGDLVNLGRQFDSAVQKVLRAHGDGVSYTVPKYNKKTHEIVIYVHYEQDPNSPGGASQDGFRFKLEGDKVAFVNGDNVEDLCSLNRKSGTAIVSKELVQDFLTKFVEKEGNGVENSKPEKTPREDDGLEENNLQKFTKALHTWRSTKDGESLKEMFKSTRGFEGNTIQDKFKNAAKQYLFGRKEEEPEKVDETGEKPEGEVVTVVGQAGETAKDAVLTVGYALFIRLLEFAREDTKEDVDIHFIAEHVSQCNSEKGCATMDDYDKIVDIPEKEVDKPANPEEKTVDPLGNQEDSEIGECKLGLAEGKNKK